MKLVAPFKLAVAVVALVVAAGAGAYFLLRPQPDPGKFAAAPSDVSFGWKFPIAKFPSAGSGDKIAYSSIRDPGGIPQGLPVRLKIPTIGVDSAIEDALISSDGRMDVPAGSVNVAWFSLGPHPGQEGSAVIGGHFGISKGVPFVFYNLDKLKVGNKVYIEDDRGDTLAFVVRSIKSFDRNADATTVFTSDDGLAHLNLITCEGIWNKVNDTYPQRLVVLTDAIPPEGAVAPQAKPAVPPPPALTLRLGSRGADVVALQTALVRRGFLKMPPRVAMGYFGTLTRTAVTKYQASVGLPRAGVLDVATRAKLFPQKVATSPTLPTAAIAASASADTIATPSIAESLPTLPRAIVQSVRGLYATTTDGIVTSILLLSVIFVLFKLARRWHG